MDARNNTQNDWRAPAGDTPSMSTPASQATNHEPYVGAAHGQTVPLGEAPERVTKTNKAPKKRTGLVGLLLVAMLLTGMVMGGAGAGAVLALNGYGAGGNASTATATLPAVTAGTGSATTELAAQLNETTINSIYKAVSPSVVRINTIIQSNNGRFSQTGEATGTGLVLDTQGHILTNYHVINGASKITVVFEGGNEYTAQVAGTAQQDDLAILKISAPSNALVAAKLGDSSKVVVGDPVVAIGYPYGLDQSVTSGIVSGLNRDGAGSANSRTLSGLIQVDAAINPGNSGGPLLNAQGQVIGVNTMIESPVEGFTGVGLAIPINTVKSLMTQLEAGGQVQRPWLGISGTEITSSMASTYNLPVSKGILVMEVAQGSPAEAAGLQGTTTTSSSGNSQDPFGQNGTNGSDQIQQVGDIITAIDGHQVTSVADLTSYLNGKTPGQKVTLQIIRNGSQKQVPVTLGTWSENAQ